MSTAQNNNQDIAIIGMACRFPGANNYNQFWDNLINGRNSIGKIPLERFDKPNIFSVKTDKNETEYYGGFIDDVAAFDADFFGISRKEAECMDPQQRILMELTWSCFEDAGMAKSDWTSKKIGAFIGVTNFDYKEIQEKRAAQGVDIFYATATAPAVIANRLSYYFNLKGPSIAIDTACSSSLNAVHLAIQSMQNGECEMAIAGGISLLLSDTRYVSLLQMGILSPTGSCKTFDDAADGYVRSEGAGVVLLKPLAKALEDGDTISGILKGSAVNHGGKTYTLTYPSADAQADVLVAAFTRAGISPESISYMELHGTGTPKGDPIEFDGLCKAFSKFQSLDENGRKNYCGLASVKSNTGHLESAAGMAGLIKVILSMKHRTLPPMQNFKQLNHRISLENTPFYVVDKLTKWESSTGSETFPLRAGISSFGFAGTNAHVIVEESPVKITTEYTSDSPVVIVISAKNKVQLNERAANLKAYLLDTEASVFDIAYTLQIGRESMNERLAFVAKDKATLLKQLSSFLETDIESHNENVFIGSILKDKSDAIFENEVGQSFLTYAIANKEIKTLAQLWAKGMDVNWKLLYPENKPNKISLPTYPFAKEIYWLPELINQSATQQNNQQLHPLLHSNISNFKEQKFISIYTGQEDFLIDHQVRNKKILPGVAYLELAREAAAQSTQQTITHLKDVTWLSPIHVNGTPQQVQTNLFADENNDVITFKVSTQQNGIQQLHCEGKLSAKTNNSINKINVEAIKNRLHQSKNGKDCYALFAEKGLNYGATFQGIEIVYYSENEALSKINLPKENGYTLAPGVVDSALQTCMALSFNKEANKLQLPFSVKEVIILKDLPQEIWCYVSKSSNNKTNGNITAFNVDLMNLEGDVLLTFRDFVTLPIDSYKKNQAKNIRQKNEIVQEGIMDTLFVPVWERTAHIQPSFVIGSGKQLLINGDFEVENVNNFKEILVANELEIAETIKTDGVTDVYFLQGLTISTNDLQLNVKQKEIAVFNSVKELLSSNYNDKNLNITFITTNTQKILNSNKVTESGAGIIGLAGSLAKEQPFWKVKMIDLESVNVSTNDWEKVLSTPFANDGSVTAFRRGYSYKRVLFPVDLSKQNNNKLCENGVYVILGGAGGLGKVTTAHLVKNYNAKVIWLGRKPLDETIIEAQNEIQKMGVKPIYVSCDANDKTSMENAFNEIKSIYPNINGLFHSAIVLNDMLLKNMDETDFRKSFEPKSLASHHFVETFSKEPLDFICFYSSAQSQLNAPGQSNYAAGCNYKDSYAYSLEQKLNVPVHIINWGYWGEVGIVSSEAYQKRLSVAGIGSITTEEGMTVLEDILSSEQKQVIAIKLLNKEDAALGNIVWDKKIKPTGNTSSINFQLPTIRPFATDELAEAALQQICSLALLQVLLKMDLQKHLQLSFKEISNEIRIKAKYQRLFNSLINLLQQENYFELNENKIIISENVKTQIRIFNLTESINKLSVEHPEYTSKCKLLLFCLKELENILIGTKQATDVIFPDGSLDLVSGIYKNNYSADYFNELLSNIVLESVSAAIPCLKPNEKVKILEIGAGTGGSSEVIFKKLSAYKNQIEYVYTDVSKSFLIYAEDNYKTIAPYLQTALFNIEQSPEKQNLAIGEFDIVIGVNVVHATKNIANTLSNIKPLLKKNGLLLLNEVAKTELFTSLTFGLLDGWWVYEDVELRLEGSPGLSAESWDTVLTEVGFNETSSWPKIDDLSQQIVIAKSDGNIQLIAEKSLQSKTDFKIIEAFKKEEIITVDKDWITDQLITIAAGTIKLPKEEFDTEEQFMDYGFDSILGTTLVKNINEALHISLMPTDIFNYTNIAQLAVYIQETFVDAINVKPEINKPTNVDSLKQQNKNQSFKIVEAIREEIVIPTIKPVSKSDIAIVGISGQFGSANNLDEYWDALKAGKSLIEEVPADRFDLYKFYSTNKEELNKTYCKWGSFLKDIDKFDPLFFKISGSEAKMMDPQQRLFLEHCWKAIEDAAINPQHLKTTKCGVFVGVAPSDYLDSVENKAASAFWGNTSSILASRISYFLDLKGPAISLDTACSSSLVAMNMGCASLQNGDTDMIITGGVTVFNSANFYIHSSRSGMLSPDGKCYAFDSRANGFVPGEGVGVIIMKRLEDAERDGDQIYGVIKGSLINQDGTTNGIFAPSALSQKQLEKDVYTKFNINPETISYVEAHGTGTSLGDPIEFEALSGAFKSFTQQKQFCSLGSVKTNIGHTLVAAGVAGLFKILLAFKYKQLPPTINYKENNPLIDLTNSPFKIQENLQDWETVNDNPRRAALSSFGFSGTNAHVVLEEYKPAFKNVYTNDLPALIVLSAKNTERLDEQVLNFKTFIEINKQADFYDIAYTLQVGREPMEERLALVAKNKTDLLKKLGNYLIGYKENVFVGNNKTDKSNFLPTGNAGKIYLETVIQDKELTTLAQLWVKGTNIDWDMLYPINQPQKISLPSYPFERKRYWLDLPTVAEPIGKAKSLEKIEPLIDLIPNETIQPLQLKLSSVQKHFNLKETSHKTDLPMDTIIKAEPKKISLVTANNLPATESGFSTKEIETTLLKELSSLLYLEMKELGINKTFSELGLDSILAVELIKTINRLFNIELKASKLYDYPTVGELSGYLKTLLVSTEEKSTESNTLFTLKGLEEPKILNVSESEQNSINHFFKSLKIEENNIEPIIFAKSTEFNPIISTSIKASIPEIETILLKELGILLYLEQRELDVNKVFSDLGLDSILAVELIKKINKHFNVELKASKLYDYPTVKELALFLSTEINETVEQKPFPIELSDNNAIVNPKQIFKAVSVEGDYEKDREVKIYYEINTLNSACLRDHLVFDKNLLPTDAYFEILYSALIKYFAVEYVEITNVLISKPFVGEDNTSRLAKLQLKEMTDGRLRFIISSKAAEEEIELVHIKGFETGNRYKLEKLIWMDEQDAQKIFTPAELKSLVPQAITKGIYENTIKSLVFTSTGAAGKIELTKENHHTNIAQVMDAALGFAMSYGPHVLKQKTLFANDIAWLPYAIQKTIITKKSTVGAYYCVVRETGVSDEKIMLDFEVTTADGQVVLRAEGLELRPVKTEQLVAAISPKNRKTVELPVENTIKIEQKEVVGNVPFTENQSTDIAVIGMSCKYAGAENVTEFWKNLTEGVDSITEVATERWGNYEWYNPDPLNEHTAYCKWGGFIKNTDKFDPLFFGVSPREAEVMDPQQRLFLEESWKAMEDAGYSAKALYRKKVGVFVGAGAGDYLQLLQQHQGNKAGPVFTGNSQAILAARVSYFMNLTGPAMPIDTACSSSLVAINRACQSIINGESEMALAGGIALLTTPMYHIWTSQVGMPSKDGKCKTFDNDADGIVPGEGIGLVVLKKLTDAEKDGDRVYAIIKGSGVNQDGKTNGITAPSARSQTELELSVYEKYNINPATISYVEAHGTGTKLGDPIEIDALTDSFSKHTNKKHFCAVGSVKTNIGHTGFASGVAGVIKTILMMQNKQYVPSLHYRTTNTGIDLQRSPFYVNTKLKEWKTENDTPRRAAVSSFGFSGTNAHLVLEEYQPKVEPTFTTTSPAIIVLSAKNEECLKALVLNLKNHLEQNSNINLNDIAYTLQIGREAMEERLAFVAKNTTDLLKTLSDYLENKTTDLLKGNINQDNSGFELEGGAGKAYIQYAIENKESKSIAQLWVKGVDINWNLLYPTQKPNKVSLPGYPFQKKRCWIDTSKNKNVAPAVSIINKVELIETTKESENVLAEIKTETIKLNENELIDDVSIVPTIAEIETILANEICRLLYLEPEELAENTSFHKLGLDSILGIELIKSISQQFKINVTATKLYAYPTIKELAVYLQNCLLETNTATVLVDKKITSGDEKPQLSSPAKLALKLPEENDLPIVPAKTIKPLSLLNVSNLAAPIENNRPKPLGKNIQFLKQHLEKRNGVGVLSDN